jgi:hypothetical protein
LSWIPTRAELETRMRTAYIFYIENLRGEIKKKNNFPTAGGIEKKNFYGRLIKKIIIKKKKIIKPLKDQVHCRKVKE